MKQWLKEKGPGLALKVLLSALTPVTAFFLMQWIYAGEFQAFPFYVILANGICLAAFYYLAAAATGRLLLASLLTHMAAGLLGGGQLFCGLIPGKSHPSLGFDRSGDSGGGFRNLPVSPDLADDPGLGCGRLCGRGPLGRAQGEVLKD